MACIIPDVCKNTCERHTGVCACTEGLISGPERLWRNMCPKRALFPSYYDGSWADNVYMFDQSFPRAHQDKYPIYGTYQHKVFKDSNERNKNTDKLNLLPSL